jgi:hypothetical protein
MEVSKRGRGTTASMVFDTIIEDVLQIESLSFMDDNRWHVHNGTMPFYITIEDVEFLAKIDAGAPFGKDDLLSVDVRRIQKVVDDRLVIDHRVIKVREHRAIVTALASLALCGCVFRSAAV